MKTKLFLSCAMFLLFFTHAVMAQRNYFMYLQTEDNSPFYVQLNKKNLSSSAAGHLIVSALTNGSYTFLVGFPGQNALQEYEVLIQDADQGFFIRKTEKGYSLVNMHTLVAQTNGSVRKDREEKQRLALEQEAAEKRRAEEERLAKEAAEKRRAEEERVAKEAVEKRRAEEERVAKEAAEKRRAEEERRAREAAEKGAKERENEAAEKRRLEQERTAAETAEKNRAAEIKAAQEAADQRREAEEKAAREAAQARETAKKEAEVLPVRDSSSTPVPVIPSGPKNVTNADKPQDPSVKAGTQASSKNKPLSAAEIARLQEEARKIDARGKRDSLYKAQQKKTANEPQFLDMDITMPEQRLAADSAKMSVPSAAKPVAKAPEVPAVSDTATVTGAEVLPAVKPEVPLQKDSVSAMPAPNPLCRASATDADVDLIAMLMKGEKTSEDALEIARKTCKAKCLSTGQVRKLALLFSGQEERYLLLDLAYKYTTDRHQYASLSDLLSDTYYLNRFKAMLQ